MNGFNHPGPNYAFYSFEIGGFVVCVIYYKSDWFCFDNDFIYFQLVDGVVTTLS
jgi:hypothetical protein